MIEFTVSGQNYRAGKLDAFKQLHVSRRLAPIIPTLIPIFIKLSKDGMSDLSALGELLGPFATAMASMPDEAAEYVVSTCMSVVSRQQGSAWSPVWSARGNVVMFDDIDLGVMLPIIVRVVQDNLGPFINGLLTSQQTASTPASNG